MNFGVTVDVMTDLFASFAAPTYWLHRLGQDWMIWNPNLFIEASGYASVTISLWVIELTFTMRFVGYKITPFDFQWSWDLDKKKRSCYSVGLYQEIFDLQFEVEQNTYECYLGLLGFLIPTYDVSTVSTSNVSQIKSHLLTLLRKHRRSRPTMKHAHGVDTSPVSPSISLRCSIVATELSTTSLTSAMTTQSLIPTTR